MFTVKMKEKYNSGFWKVLSASCEITIHIYIYMLMQWQIKCVLTNIGLLCYFSLFYAFVFLSDFQPSLCSYITGIDRSDFFLYNLAPESALQTYRNTHAQLQSRVLLKWQILRKSNPC